MTIEEVHTFAVGAGDWVVHNCGRLLPGFEPPPIPNGVVSPDVRAREIANVMPEPTQSSVTISVGDARNPETGDIYRLFSSSESTNRVSVESIYDYEYEVSRQSGAGHAEDNIMQFVNENGWELLEAGASRPICLVCEQAITGAGGIPCWDFERNTLSA